MIFFKIETLFSNLRINEILKIPKKRNFASKNLSIFPVFENDNNEGKKIRQQNIKNDEI